MKILLAACNAKYIHSNLAVYSLRAYARSYRERILLKEYTINQRREDILKDIYRERPGVVCVSCYIWNISFVKALFEDLRKVLPKTPFWAGGPEVSFDPEDFLKENPAFTGVMVGEGEETFRELAEHYVDGKKGLEEIKGIVFRQEGEIRSNGERELLDLGDIPFPYDEDLEDFSNRIIYYESSRGCPFSCSYCLSSVEKKLRFRRLDLVKRELSFFLDHQVPQVKFVDRTFNCSHDHAMEIWEYIASHDNGITNFHFEISADLLTEEELCLMETMRPGLIQLEIGVQSTNEKTIEAIRRTMDLEKLSQTVGRIRSFSNIHQHLDLIAGLPWEDYESFHRSFNQVYALRPHQLQLGFLKTLKGSYMKEMEREYGLIHTTREPYEVLSTKWLSFDDILRLKMVESMVEIYYNSGQFTNTLACLERWFPDPFELYQALGDFYEKRGYQEISHSRLRRYEILLEFLEEVREEGVPQAADAMTLDLYLRENLKSRPAFALDQKPYEKMVWAYRRENRIPKTCHVEVLRSGRTLLFDYTRRDPLTNNSFTKEITLGGEGRQ